MKRAILLLPGVAQKPRGVLAQFLSVASTYVAYLAKKLRLRPYLVSLDNGYDSEITKRNLTAIAANLQTDLHTHRVEPGEFRDLQLAYLKAGVINIEVLTDHAILALLYRTAAKLRLRFILSGSNLVTEAILPPAWGGYSDVRDFPRIMDIYSRHGSGRRLETYPTLSLADFARYNSFKRIRLLALLNYVSYVKKDVKTLLAREFQYEDYGPKHCESIFTRFFQFHILSRRLGVDKRRAHLSSLVMAAQMTRAEALAELTNPPYTEASLAHDRRYVADYLGIGEGELENLIAQPVRSLDGYRSDHLLRTTYAAVINPIAAAKWLVRQRQASP